MQTIWPPSRDSIFGDTYGGVPNPNVPHRHPWPTRYHGPIYTVPGVAKPTYRQRPYTKAPYMGIGWFEADKDNERWYKQSSLGAVSPFDPLSGNRYVDAVGGAAVGYLISPKETDRPLWAIVGALAGYAAGFMGLAGTVGAGIYLRKK